MSSKTQFLGKQVHYNAPAPARTISARRAKPSARIALALALAAFVIWRPTWAEGPLQSYAIPAGSLEDALMEFAAQADLKLIFKTDLVRSARSAGLTGTLTPEQGVARLLEGSGIAYRFVDPNTVTIEPAAPVDPLERLVAEARTPMDYAGATEPTPKKPEAPPKETQEGPTVLPEMTVTATPGRDTSYNPPNATTATKTDTPLMETPVSIQVVPQQVLRDQQAYRLEDALKNVSGVQRQHGGGDFLDSFVIRGFENRFARFRNSMRIGGGFTTELTNVERLEVLKGPAAVLYGRLEPGGMINAVTKRPLSTPYYSLEQQFGSYDLYRTTLDATGPLTADGNVLYRLNFSYLNKGSFRDFLDGERLFIAPSLTWRPRNHTEVNLTFEYRDEDLQFDSGIPAIGNRPAPVPISRRYDEPGNQDQHHVPVVEFNFSHHFNPDWTVRTGFLGVFADHDQQEIIPINIRDDNRTIERGIFSDDLDSSSISNDEYRT